MFPTGNPEGKPQHTQVHKSASGTWNNQYFKKHNLFNNSFSEDEGRDHLEYVTQFQKCSKKIILPTFKEVDTCECSNCLASDHVSCDQEPEAISSFSLKAFSKGRLKVLFFPFLPAVVSLHACSPDLLSSDLKDLGCSIMSQILPSLKLLIDNICLFARTYSFDILPASQT